MLAERLYNGIRIPDSYGILSFLSIMGEIWRLNSDIVYVKLIMSEHLDEDITGIALKICIPLGVFDDTCTNEKTVTLGDSKINLKLIGARLLITSYSTVYLYSVDLMKPEFDHGNQTIYFNPLDHSWVKPRSLDIKDGDTMYLLKDPLGKIYGLVSKYDIEAPAAAGSVILDSVYNASSYLDNITNRIYTDYSAGLIEKIEPNLNAPHYLSAVLLTKNENDYLFEFLEENTKAGFDYFYIYDNNDDDHKVSDFIKGTEWENKCTVKQIKQIKNIQYEAYQDFMFNYKDETTWASFIDTDEIYSGDVKALCQQLQDNCPTVTIDWTIHNANGHLDRPKGRQVDNFTKVVPYNLPCVIGKVIVQPKFLTIMYVHDVSVHPAYYTFRPGNDIKEEENYIPDFEIKLHHYMTRSAEEWVDKILRGSCDPSALRRINDFLLFNSEIEDEFNNYLEKRGISKQLTQT